MRSKASRFAGRRAWLAGLALLVVFLAGCASQPGEVAQGDMTPTTVPLPPSATAVAPTPTDPSPPPSDTAAAPAPTDPPPTDTDTPPPPSPVPPEPSDTPDRDPTPTVAASPASPTPAVCPPTQPDQLGPFYEPGAPLRSSVGQGHVLAGTVRSSADCSPLAGAQIEFWLAGPAGEYADAYRATVLSANGGTYRFESNLPPPYSGRPPHIHIRVSAEGYETLVTQYYPPAGQEQGTFDLVLVPQATAAAPPAPVEPSVEEFPVPAGSRPHDVAPAPDGTVWYTAQGLGELGRRVGRGQARGRAHAVNVFNDGKEGPVWIVFT